MIRVDVSKAWNNTRGDEYVTLSRKCAGEVLTSHVLQGELSGLFLTESLQKITRSPRAVHPAAWHNGPQWSWGAQ